MRAVAGRRIGALEGRARKRRVPRAQVQRIGKPHVSTPNGRSVNSAVVCGVAWYSSDAVITRPSRTSGRQ
jgi:hypothetical protein